VGAGRKSEVAALINRKGVRMDVRRLIQNFEAAVEHSKMNGGGAVHVGPFDISELVEILAALKYKNPEPHPDPSKRFAGFARS